MEEVVVKLLVVVLQKHLEDDLLKVFLLRTKKKENNIKCQDQLENLFLLKKMLKMHLIEKKKIKILL
jgi:hypothetical protein